MPIERFPIFSVGHSQHSPKAFLGLLAIHDISIVLDVRSTPFSRHVPHHSRPVLEALLRNGGVRYIFGGASLGGRPRELTYYENGRASYEALANAPFFRRGLRKVAALARTDRVALMCSEADPLECHRFLLIGRMLHEAGLQLQHILPTGELEMHSDAEQRMVMSAGLSQGALFDNHNLSPVADAYRIFAARFAYTLSIDEPQALEGDY